MRSKHLSGIVLYKPLAALLLFVCSHASHAGCNLLSAVSVSPSNVNVGTYVGLALPSISTTTLTITVSATGSGGGSCTLGIVLRRSSTPAALNTIPANLVSLPYAATLGGLSLTYGASAAASPSSVGVTATLTAPGNGITANISTTTSLVVTPTTVIGTPSFGSHSDSLFIDLYEVQGSNKIFKGTLSLTLTATVSSTCSIDSAANTSQTIRIGSTGLTSGMITSSPTFNVTCPIASNVTLSSQNGAVTRGGVAEGTLTTVSGFRSKIEYSAAIATAGTTHASLNTSSASSVGPTTFRSSAIISVATTVTITPETSTVPLRAGSYSDVLTITIVPQ
jgi:hypothetical protein